MESGFSGFLHSGRGRLVIVGAALIVIFLLVRYLGKLGIGPVAPAASADGVTSDGTTSGTPGSSDGGVPAPGASPVPQPIDSSSPYLPYVPPVTGYSPPGSTYGPGGDTNAYTQGSGTPHTPMAVEQVNRQGSTGVFDWLPFDFLRGNPALTPQAAAQAAITPAQQALGIVQDTWNTIFPTTASTERATLALQRPAGYGLPIQSATAASQRAHRGLAAPPYPSVIVPTSATYDTGGNVTRRGRVSDY